MENSLHNDLKSFIQSRSNDLVLVLNPGYAGDAHRLQYDFVQCSGGILVCEGLYVWLGSMSKYDYTMFRLKHGDGVLFVQAWDEFESYVNYWSEKMMSELDLGENKLEMALVNICLDILSSIRTESDLYSIY